MAPKRKNTAPKKKSAKPNNVAKSHHNAPSSKRSDTIQTVVPHKCKHCGDKFTLRGDELLAHTNECRRKQAKIIADKQIKKQEEKKDKEKKEEKNKEENKGAKGKKKVQ